MTAKLIKEERVDGSLVYYTEISGQYVDKSMSFNVQEAQKFYKHILAHGHMDPIKTVLEFAPVLTKQSESVERVSSKVVSCKDLVDKFCDGPATAYLDASAIAHCREQTTLVDLMQAVSVHMDFEFPEQAAHFVIDNLDYECD